MPTPQPKHTPTPRIVKRRIVPPQAPEVAARFRQVADRVDGLGGELERVGGNLEPTWEGNSKNKFFANYSPVPGQIRSLADMLRQLANEIERITIEIEETVWD